jgi:hypothetical protein
MDRYTTYAARQLHEDGRRAGLLQLVGHPPLAFLRNYIAKAGIRDGAPGLIISAMNAYYVFLKFAKLWELGRAPVHPENTNTTTSDEADLVRDVLRGPRDAS